MVWYEGLENWIKIEEVPEFQNLILPQPPPFIRQQPPTIEKTKENIEELSYDEKLLKIKIKINEISVKINQLYKKEITYTNEDIIKVKAKGNNNMNVFVNSTGDKILFAYASNPIDSNVDYVFTDKEILFDDILKFKRVEISKIGIGIRKSTLWSDKIIFNGTDLYIEPRLVKNENQFLQFIQYINDILNEIKKLNN